MGEKICSGLASLSCGWSNRAAVGGELEPPTRDYHAQNQTDGRVASHVDGVFRGACGNPGCSLRLRLARDTRLRRESIAEKEKREKGIILTLDLEIAEDRYNPLVGCHEEKEEEEEKGKEEKKEEEEKEEEEENNEMKTEKAAPCPFV
ncbi:hypothetical protein E2C01_000886 [Portunus trituberculatus]|uniref:Uncharacterized protein n=1 Tax=Portunus trituberculatus TaxID=210409 RepID=A0A5B7CG84_PORTR|nr:hypothetical protein [Portunus trituberculatus]